MASLRSLASHCCAVLGCIAAATAARAQTDKERWRGPFGGSFNASFTLTTDYSYAGISNTQLGPAFQANVDYRTPDLTDSFPVWLFLSGFGTNISFH